MSKAASKPAVKKTSSLPSYEALVKEAIVAHPEASRVGVSRQAIKNFIRKKYPAASKTPEASFNNHLANAIKKGAEKKVFTLPKGVSGKVKLSQAAKKPAAKKPAAKKTAVKKPAGTKKPAAKKTTTAKKPAAKKTTAAKKTKSSTATKAKKPAAKKTATAKKAAPKKKAVAKKA